MKEMIRLLNLITPIIFLCGLLPEIHAQTYQEISAFQADSLIGARTEDPKFVILDVRRPSEYIPEHLEGAINRDYFDPSFEAWIDELNREKTYLIHCKSGSRSGNTFILMQSLGFNEVYNMYGGINEWKGNGLPVTGDFSPLLMCMDALFYDMETIPLGESDTLSVTLTNRANDTLVFNTVCSAEGEFQTDFNPETMLTGAQDYTFHIYYTPADEIADSLKLCIDSNGGNTEITVLRNGVDNTTRVLTSSPTNPIFLAPNPAASFFELQGPTGINGKLYIVDHFGRKIGSQMMNALPFRMDISDIPSGNYRVIILHQNGLVSLPLQVGH